MGEQRLRMKSASFRDKPDDPPQSPASPADALSEIAQDPVLSKFLAPDFNPTLFASAALRSGSAAASAHQVELGLTLLDKHLRREVSLRHPDLLSHLSTAQQMPCSLALIRSAVADLQSSSHKVRSEVSQPYQAIRSKSRHLSSMHQTLELLRAIVRVLRTLRRLRELLESTPGRSTDLAKAAQLYNEIERVRVESDLSGIHLVDSELPWLLQAGGRIRGDAMQGLEAGLKAFNQAEVGGSLQVYFNLGELRPTVEGVVQRYKSLAVKSIAGALDLKAISASVAASAAGVSAAGSPGGVYRSGTPQLGGGSRAREGLWQRVSGCFEQLHAILLAMWHLERVLSKKRDPVSHARFLDEVFQAGEPLITERVWEVVVKTFASQMKSAFTASSFVKEIFVLGYPKLLGMADTFLQRLVRDTDVKGALPAIRSTDREQLMSTLEPFQNAYLAHTLSRLTDLINSMFSSPLRGGGVPTSQEPIVKLVTRVQEEVEAAKLDPGLLSAVVKEVGKVLHLFAEKSEYQIATGPDARQASGPATASQKKNIALCLQSQELHHRLSSMLAGFPPAAAEVLSPALNAIHSVAVETITPLFKAMLERLEKSILRLHEVDFSSDMSVEDDDRGGYMGEIQEAAALFRNEFLSKLSVFSPPAAAAQASVSIMFARKMASRVLVLFVRHAALVRPLSEHGKLRMARDMAELELVVAQNLFPVEQLGAAYRSLRAFRPFIFLETTQVSTSSLLQDLPPSVMFHHLYTRAPEELESPMKRFKLTPAQYSLWLDSHSDEEVWKEVKATLDEYADGVKARGDTHFSPVYPLMLQLANVLQLAG